MLYGNKVLLFCVSSVFPLNGTVVQGIDDATMGVAKPDFLRCVGADQISIENAGRFARIDLDLSDFEKERTQCIEN